MSNEIIHRCSAEIPLVKIFEGDVEKCKTALEESIEACDSWKRLYTEMMEQFVSQNLNLVEETESVEHPHMSELGTRSIFAPLESFLQRCQDILEV